MTNNTDDSSIGHTVIETCRSGNIVTRIFEKKVPDGKVYYDFSISREYYKVDESGNKEGPFYSSKLQQRDFNDLIYAIMDAKVFIQEQIYSMKNTSGD